MKIIYSIGAKFAGPGIGYTAYQAVRGIYRHDLLARLLSSYAVPSLIPANLIKTFGLPGKLLRCSAHLSKSDLGYLVHDSLYDAWASRHLTKADLFHGWNNHSLYSLRAAQKRKMITVIERASAHPLTEQQILNQEYSRNNVPSMNLSPKSLSRSLQEFKETDFV